MAAILFRPQCVKTKHDVLLDLTNTTGLHNNSGPLFTKQTDVLTQDLVKFPSREIGV